MARKILTALDMTSQSILNVASPSAPGDAANKAYVDNLVQGMIWKASVRAATTANGTLATAFANGQTVDGVTLVTGNRILLKNQTTGADNGIYTVPASGAPVRATDADVSAEVVANMTVYVAEGTTQADTAWTLVTNNPITLGTTALSFNQVGGGGVAPTAGPGLSLASNTYTIGSNAGSGIIVNADDITIDTAIVPRKFSITIGTGAATSIAVTHSLGTRDVDVTVYDLASFEEIECDIVRTSTTVVTLGFAVAPATNALRAVVMG